MGVSRFSFKIFEEINQSIPDNAEHPKKERKKKKTSLLDSDPAGCRDASVVSLSKTPNSP